MHFIPNSILIVQFCSFHFILQVTEHQQQQQQPGDWGGQHQHKQQHQRPRHRGREDCDDGGAWTEHHHSSDA